MMVSASTGAMNSVIGKLTALLSDEYKHLTGVKKGIRWLRDELGSMNAVLQRLADMEDDDQQIINAQIKEWRSKVRELSYDIEDCIDRFTRRVISCGGEAAKAPSSMRKAARKVKLLWEDHQIGNEIQELKARVTEESQRRDRYSIDQLLIATTPHHVAALDPRAPVLYEEARNLVGIDEPREKIVGWIEDEEKQLKVVSIFGTAGLGKTTLAIEVYRKTEESFDCRALVSVSRTPNIKKLLRDILFQINESEYDHSKEWEMEQLIPTLRKNLKDKRYFVIVDDIWSTDAWEHLKCALPINDNRSRIITTTRNKNVARGCCAGFGGHMYEGKTLREAESASLFFRRVFSSEDCPTELMDVANEILRKCDGLPLAIISMAGLLANKTPTLEEWIKTRNSISFAVEKGSSIGKMKTILSFSYFDLPQHLKTCLLYFSVFPEDCCIDTRFLVWKWIAEGLITGKNQENMEQQGESYLNELINRSMIQAIKIGANGTRVKSCRVHDVILDFIVSQAVEENFVITFDGNDCCYRLSNKIRRLSLQGIFPEGAEKPKTVDLSHLRSLHMFGYDYDSTQVSPQFLNCQVLQVLDIEHIRKLEDNHFDHIGRMCQLKFLGITNTYISELPEQIGKLQLLETLDLRANRIEKLPASIVQLQKLVRLFIHTSVPLPDGIGSLQALEELSFIDLGQASLKSIQGLGQLTKLRALEISWKTYYQYMYECYMGIKEQLVRNAGHEKVCISSISKLLACGLQSLTVREMGISDIIDSWMIPCGSPRPLRRLVLEEQIPTMPSHIGSLVNLTRLSADVSTMEEEDLGILASLPLLLSLTLHIQYTSVMGVVISNQGFQRLVKFKFATRFLHRLMFEAGAMPELQRLTLKLCPKGPVLGLLHLPGLKSIALTTECSGNVAEKVESFEDVVREAALVHPNRPVLEIKRSGQEHMRKS